MWHRQLHIFQVPFYYIEYGIAQIGALQLWVQSKKDYRAAVENYRKALKLGGSRPLPELFAAAGLKFDLSEKVLGPLMEEIDNELANMN
jgi:oligoendopeptidase F